MDATLKNLAANPHACGVSTKKGHYRLRSQGEVHRDGKFLALAKERGDGPEPKAAILLRVGEIFDLDKAEKVA